LLEVIIPWTLTVLKKQGMWNKLLN
jgi:hypothetical protein